MKKQAVILFILVLFANCLVYGQENFATNIQKRIVQGEIIYISFEILPSPEENTFSVAIVPMIEGQIIKVSEAYGDIGKNILSGNREIIWYFKSDFAGNINDVEINVYAYEEYEVEKPSELPSVISESSSYQRHKTMKNIWLGAAVTSGAVGGYAIIRSNSLKNDYKTATDDAEAIRKKYQTMGVVYPIALVVAGVSVSQVIIQSKKQKQAEQAINIHVSPVYDGVVVGLTWKF